MHSECDIPLLSCQSCYQRGLAGDQTATNSLPLNISTTVTECTDTRRKGWKNKTLVPDSSKPLCCPRDSHTLVSHTPRGHFWLEDNTRVTGEHCFASCIKPWMPLFFSGGLKHLEMWRMGIRMEGGVVNFNNRRGWEWWGGQRLSGCTSSAIGHSMQMWLGSARPPSDSPEVIRFRMIMQCCKIDLEEWGVVVRLVSVCVCVCVGGGVAWWS